MPNPIKHNRRSIRLKGHDYAGGGVYFVTICAHRDAGNIFAPPDVKTMVAQEWESAAAAVGAPVMGAPSPRIAPAIRPYVIMPDHFHALIEVPAGKISLGEVIGAFKSRVVHKYIRGVKNQGWPRFPGKIWHRNYYEAIVRNAEAEKKIAQYIRMNPWKLIVEGRGSLHGCPSSRGGAHEGHPYRGIGNPALLNAEKLGVFCSRKAPPIRRIAKAEVYMGGFHSPPEQAILAELLKRGERIIYCPAWDIESAIQPELQKALEQNRLFLLEMKNRAGNLAAAEERNRFVMQAADCLWLPHVTPGGMLDGLIRELQVQEKVILRPSTASILSATHAYPL